MEEPGLPMEESVDTQGPGQTGTVACATCWSYATWASVLTLNAPPVGCSPTALALKQLSTKIVTHINITLWSKFFTPRIFVLM